MQQAPEYGPMAVLDLSATIAGVTFHDGLHTFPENLIDDGFVLAWIDCFLVTNFTGQSGLLSRCQRLVRVNSAPPLAMPFPVGMSFV